MKIKVLKLFVDSSQEELENKLQDWVDSIDLNIVDLKVTYTISGAIIYTAVCFPQPEPTPIEISAQSPEQSVIIQG